MKQIMNGHEEQLKETVYIREESRLNTELLDSLDGEMALGEFQQFKFEMDKAINSLKWHTKGELPLWFYATPNHTGNDEIHFQIMSKLHRPNELEGVAVTGTTTVEYKQPLTLEKYLKIVEQFIENNFR